MTKYTPLFLVLFAALLLSACGAGGSDGLSISVSDDTAFNPKVITVKAGEEVTLTFDNTGSVEHSFNILNADAELEHLLEEAHDEEAAHDEIFFEVHEVAPGASVTETFTAPTEPGDYVIACLVPGMAEAGMVGTLRVTE